MKLKLQHTPQALLFIGFSWFVIVFLIVPNLNILYTTFIQEGGLTFEPFEKLLRSERAMNSLKNSFILAVSLSITVNIVGTLLVLITEYFEIKGAKILKLGYMTTLIYGGVILISGYRFLYGDNGYLTNFLASIFPSINTKWFEGYWAVLFVMTFACTSNHVIFLSNAIRKVDYQTIEAAKNMGANQWTILFRIVLPVLLPSIFAMTILVFLTGLSAVSAPIIVGGDDFQTINPMILTFSGSLGSRDLAALLSIFLGIATIILLTFFTKIEKKGYYMSISKVKSTIEKQKISSPLMNIIFHGISYVLFFIYTTPVILVILFSFTDSRSIAQRDLSFASFTLANYIDLVSNPSSYKPFIVSILYAFIASFGVVTLCVLAARVIHKYKNALTSALEYALLIPWMLPSTMIAIGLIITFSVPNWYIFNTVLTGTLSLMGIAYLIVKIPFTLRMTKAAFFSVDDSLEDAAKNLGASTFYTFFRVLLPIILPAVLAVFALNVNSLLTDYDLSVFLYHPIFQPLGVFIRGLTKEASSDKTALTFVYAVLVMIISSLVLYMVYGRKTRRQ